jgi:hypothetical protein
MGAGDARAIKDVNPPVLVVEHGVERHASKPLILEHALDELLELRGLKTSITLPNQSIGAKRTST